MLLPFKYNTTVLRQKGLQFNWAKTIIEVLENENRLMVIDDFVTVAFTQIDNGSTQKYRDYLSMALYKLEKRKSLRSCKLIKKRVKLYGLPNMFETVHDHATKEVCDIPKPEFIPPEYKKSLRR